MERAADFSIGLDPAASRELKRYWAWFVALRVALIVLGAIALGAVGFVTLASVLLYGWLLVIGGIVQVVLAFGVRRWGDFTGKTGAKGVPIDVPFAHVWTVRDGRLARLRFYTDTARTPRVLAKALGATDHGHAQHAT